MSSNLLTHSRLSTAKVCLRKHFFAYEVGLRKAQQSTPLRMGSAVHLGLERLSITGDLQEACNAVRANYAEVPSWVQDFDEWITEAETCCCLVSGYQWRWSQPNDGLERAPNVVDTVATELEFVLPLRNPETGYPSTNWKMAGKTDRIVRLVDGRVAILETKTTGDDIGPDSDFWRRLRMDQQISLYVIAAREMGYPVETVVYDVIRKPSIGRLQVPMLDEDGCKIVVDADGKRVFNQNGSRRQSADKAKGWTLQSRLQAPFEYANRLLEDIAARPDWYYQRLEIPRLASDIEEFQVELWQQQKLISACQSHGYWFRNTAACIHPYKCEYFDICCGGWQQGMPVPDGFEITTNVHPELNLTQNDKGEFNATTEHAEQTECTGCVCTNVDVDAAGIITGDVTGEVTAETVAPVVGPQGSADRTERCREVG